MGTTGEICSGRTAAGERDEASTASDSRGAVVLLVDPDETPARFALESGPPPATRRVSLDVGVVGKIRGRASTTPTTRSLESFPSLIGKRAKRRGVRHSRGCWPSAASAFSTPPRLAGIVAGGVEGRGGDLGELADGFTEPPADGELLDSTALTPSRVGQTERRPYVYLAASAFTAGTSAEPDFVSQSLKPSLNAELRAAVVVATSARALACPQVHSRLPNEACAIPHAPPPALAGRS